MKHLNQFFRILLEPIIIILEIILIVIFTSCISTELKISEFEFRYNNENYMVRSAYCPNNPESCNQLISDNFVAVDLNQDRIIDKVERGNISFGEAQEIYDYCLNFLESQNKLQQIDKKHESYCYSDVDFDYEIKTLFTQKNNPFNQLTITRHPSMNNNISVFIDYDADGKLNELVKGNIPIENAQKKYSFILQEGLSLQKLQKTNKRITVK